eukprot:CAMPEP_0194029734 /NCGR_PEP_ID=MMETSP0009_2-20130614/3396_1 /TAXON_ID=210454 /ORGANISM="Grammatophora oceanica, Strain CCMP 410" /LENGTH=480 /DNA_ID=CAMNT_0038669501 /DNA_START=12 /DNA_END=1454 /DNA_ORIENTATION=+
MMEVPLPPMSVVLPGSTILEIARVRKTRLNEACAVSIQSIARKKLASFEAERRKAAVSVLQRAARVCLAVKKRSERERHLIAVTTIQCWARQRRALSLYRTAMEEQRRQSAVLTLQCWARCMTAQFKVRDAREAMRLQRAATTILCMARQRKAKVAMQKAKEERAATTILCLARQHRARVAMLQAKEEHERILYLENNATVIQTIARQWLARKHRVALEKAWVVFRVLARKCLAKSNRRNATTIQSVARMFFVKLSLGPIQAARRARERSCTVLQGFGRMVLAKIAYNKLKVYKALTELEELQANVRPVIAKKKVQVRQRVKVEAKSARTIQSLARMISSKRVAQSLKREKDVRYIVAAFFKRTLPGWYQSLISAHDATQGACNRAGAVLFRSSSSMPDVRFHVKTKDARGKAVHSIYAFPGMGRMLGFILVNLVVFTVITTGRQTFDTRHKHRVLAEADVSSIEELAFEHMTSSVDMAY